MSGAVPKGVIAAELAEFVAEHLIEQVRLEPRNDGWRVLDRDAYCGFVGQVPAGWYASPMYAEGKAGLATRGEAVAHVLDVDVCYLDACGKPVERDAEGDWRHVDGLDDDNNHDPAPKTRW